MAAGIISDTSVFCSTLILLPYREEFNANVKSFASLKNYMRQTPFNSLKNSCSYTKEFLKKKMSNLKIHSRVHSCSTLVPILSSHILTSCSLKSIIVYAHMSWPPIIHSRIIYPMYLYSEIKC
jgi:hypothetical protein